MFGFLQAPAPELRELITSEFSFFQKQLESLPESKERTTLLQVATQTKTRLPLADETPEQAERKRRRRERKERQENRWYDWCCDCSCCDCSGCSGLARCGGATGGKMDACFDCGPGDTGCIDCCPCDGCSC